MAERGKLRVLVVDDDPAMAALLRSLLTAQGYDRIDWVTTGAATLERVNQTDLILLDHLLPDTTGLELLPREGGGLLARLALGH